jgi:hypothetical protein
MIQKSHSASMPEIMMKTIESLRSRLSATENPLEPNLALAEWFFYAALIAYRTFAQNILNNEATTKVH